MIKTTHESPPKLRAAAYCQGFDGTEHDPFLEAEISHYTDKIRANPDWIMAGIFADTCGSKSNRPEFLKMLQKCRQKEIDLILAKSISRFARSTADCLYTVLELRELGIAVIFEKENLNSMGAYFDALISLMHAFAKAECEHITQNSVHTYHTRPISIPKSRTWKKTIRLPGHPEKKINFRME